jgi:selenocysteine-specific translation elongation factor
MKTSTRLRPDQGVGLAIKGATVEEMKRGSVLCASDSAKTDTKVKLSFKKSAFYPDDVREGAFHATVSMQTVPITITEKSETRDFFHTLSYNFRMESLKPDSLADYLLNGMAQKAKPCRPDAKMHPTDSFSKIISAGRVLALEQGFQCVKDINLLIDI